LENEKGCRKFSNNHSKIHYHNTNYYVTMMHRWDHQINFEIICTFNVITVSKCLIINNPRAIEWSMTSIRYANKRYGAAKNNNLSQYDWNNMMNNHLQYWSHGIDHRWTLDYDSSPFHLRPATMYNCSRQILW
jgi:hypothetical protein